MKLLALGKQRISQIKEERIWCKKEPKNKMLEWKKQLPNLKQPQPR